MSAAAPDRPAEAPAPFTPGPADLDRMHKVHAIHDVLDLFPDLALDVRLALLDRARAELDATPAPELRHA